MSDLLKAILEMYQFAVSTRYPSLTKCCCNGHEIYEDKESRNDGGALLDRLSEWLQIQAQDPFLGYRWMDDGVGRSRKIAVLSAQRAVKIESRPALCAIEGQESPCFGNMVELTDDLLSVHIRMRLAITWTFEECVWISAPPDLRWRFRLEYLEKPLPLCWNLVLNSILSVGPRSGSRLRVC
ncbi:hypothetical protein CPB85DRAFT_1257012 [Mucidula mucida]|nr:hypothetical protein CPB85DRAFT_1257012 [Mucidula mucida]